MNSQKIETPRSSSSSSTPSFHSPRKFSSDSEGSDDGGTVSPFKSQKTSDLDLPEDQQHRNLSANLKPNWPFPIELLHTTILSDKIINSGTFVKYFEERHFGNSLQELGRPFVRSTAPSITLQNYLLRLFKYCQPEPLPILAIIVYSQRLLKTKTAKISAAGVHRWIVGCWVMAVKALIGDQYWTNGYWARVAGVSVSELNRLEWAVAEVLDWRLQVNNTELAEAWEILK